MKKFLFNVLAAVLCLGVAIFLSIVWFAPQKLYAGEPKVRTMERTPEDTAKPVPLADPVDAKDVVVKELSKQLYRVDVKSTAEGRAAYEKEWAAFCAEHPTARWSPAPPDGKGNTGSSTCYWNVEEK